jgi:sugar phosphate permease
MPRSRYRWVVLTVGTSAQATVACVLFSVAVLAPELRDDFDLSLAQTGVVLAALGIGMTPALLPWGLFADRAGERVVLPLGLGAAGLVLARTGSAGGYGELVALLALAGALMGSANAASGRAVMHWFAPGERGLALGIRQSSVPMGGLVAAIVLPPLADTKGLTWTYAALGVACVAAALAGALLLRTPEHITAQLPPRRQGTARRTLRRPALWLVSFGSALFLFAQTATMSFTVLFLSDERGMTPHAAALVLAAMQVLGVALRITIGLLSDRVGSRIVPLSRLGLVISASFVVVAATTRAPLVVLIPVLVVAGGIAMSWNGLAFVAAAEIAGPHATGAAIGLQQTVLGVVGTIAPIEIAAVVSASSWDIAFLSAGIFPLVGWALLRPLARAGRRARAGTEPASAGGAISPSRAAR